MVNWIIQLSKMSPGFLDRWSKHGSECNLPAWARNLRGGMPLGSHVTQRKRQEKRDSGNLASALGEFLAQWQNARPQPKRIKQTAPKVSEHTWYDWKNDQQWDGGWDDWAP